MINFNSLKFKTENNLKFCNIYDGIMNNTEFLRAYSIVTRNYKELADEIQEELWFLAMVPRVFSVTRWRRSNLGHLRYQLLKHATPPQRA